MCWLYDAGVVICYVRSRLWQNYIYIMTLLLYRSIIVVVPSFSPSLSFLLTIHMTKCVTLPLRAIGPVHPSSALVLFSEFPFS